VAYISMSLLEAKGRNINTKETESNSHDAELSIQINIIIVMSRQLSCQSILIDLEIPVSHTFFLTPHSKEIFFERITQRIFEQAESSRRFEMNMQDLQTFGIFWVN